MVTIRKGTLFGTFTSTQSVQVKQESKNNKTAIRVKYQNIGLKYVYVFCLYAYSRSNR